MFRTYVPSILFEPIDIGPVTMRNRIVSSASFSAMSDNGLFGERIALYHAEKAKAGVALTITEELAVHPSTEFGLSRNVRAFDRASIARFRRFTEIVHKYGAKTIGQLWHAGCHNLNRNQQLDIRIPLAVSPVPSMAFQDGYSVPRELTTREISEIQEDTRILRRICSTGDSMVWKSTRRTVT